MLLPLSIFQYKLYIFLFLAFDIESLKLILSISWLSIRIQYNAVLSYYNSTQSQKFLSIYASIQSNKNLQKLISLQR